MNKDINLEDMIEAARAEELPILDDEAAYKAKVNAARCGKVTTVTVSLEEYVGLRMMAEDLQRLALAIQDDLNEAPFMPSFKTFRTYVTLYPEEAAELIEGIKAREKELTIRLEASKNV